MTDPTICAPVETAAGVDGGVGVADWEIVLAPRLGATGDPGDDLPQADITTPATANPTVILEKLKPVISHSPGHT